MIKIRAFVIALIVLGNIQAQTAKVTAKTGKENEKTDSAAKAKAKSKTKAKTPAQAQPPADPPPLVIPTPEFINQPHYYEADENRLIKLEDMTAKLNTKKKTLGLSGAKQILTMENESSKIRFTYSKDISFVIKTGGDEIDLTSFIKLHKFTVNGEKREVVMNAKTGLLNNKDEEKSSSINLSVKKITQGLYMIVFAEPLEAGEYGFLWVNNSSQQEYPVYAFGIDWKKSD